MTWAVVALLALLVFALFALCGYLSRIAGALELYNLHHGVGYTIPPDLQRQVDDARAVFEEWDTE